MKKSFPQRIPLILFCLCLLACETSMEPDTPGLLVPMTVDQDPSLPAITVNGTRLHAEAFGNPQDPMILNLHGGPGADYRYMLRSQALADSGYYVVFYDQRGSGLSQRHDKSVYSIQLMLDDLSAVITHYRSSPEQPIFLLGHSWGAMLATAYINAYPDRIRGAVLAEPGGFSWQQTQEYLSRSRPSAVFSELLNDATYLDQFISVAKSEHDLPDYKANLVTSADWVEGNVIGNSGPLPYWRSGAVVSDALFEIADKQGFDFRTNLQAYQTPVLFVYSERNQAYGQAHAQALAASYPHAELVQTPGGHDMIYEAWPQFSQPALAYFNSLK